MLCYLLSFSFNEFVATNIKFYKKAFAYKIAINFRKFKSSTVYVKSFITFN